LNLVLVGVRGAGKSAVGAELARRLGLSFVDLDAEIAAAAGEPVSAIFAQSGEEGFRRLESEALERLRRIDRTVLATGGGAVIDERNRAILRELGRVVWLRVSPEIAVERTSASVARPALTELPPLEEAREVAQTRSAWYEEVADAAIDTDSAALVEVCDELEQLWRAAARDDVR
jgi:shikimate kinase